LRPSRFLALGLFCGAAYGATTIDVSTRVAVPAVKRFGINLGWMNNYDSGQIMKNLIFRNPGFEGQISQSIVRCVSGTATGCIDENANAHWPTGFWNGASYEVIVGVAKGRAGTVSTSTAPSGGNGTQYQFADSGVAPANGDYILLRKSASGGSTSGWLPNGSVTDETLDLAPDTPGHQAVRLTATGVGQTANIAAVFDAGAGGPFIQLNGMFRISFKAKGVGGGNNLNVFVGRGGTANVVYVNQNLALSGSWSTYNIDFSASESGTSVGPVTLRFTATNPSAALLDDVSLVQTNGDITNTTAFRDPVVNALKSFNPGILRYWVEDLGDSLDNEIAPPFARARSDYSSQNINREDAMYGLHEFLELCELLRAEPWYIVPTTFTTQEMSNLLEYLGGGAGTPYGARRVARGRTAPWTDAFSTIHLEFGNEAWNQANYYGGTIGASDPPSYGARGSEMFGVAKSSPYYSSSKYDLILGGQASFPGRNTGIHNASSNHDSLAVAPYFGGNIDSYGTNEDLFGPLFAEPEMLEQTGYMRQNYNNMQASSRPVPLSIYEVNLHTTTGSITQAVLDTFTPSIGAGIAVADHMLMMLRDLNIRNQVLYSLTQFANSRLGPNASYVLLWGTVRDMGVTDRRRPQFLAVRLANEAVGGDLVQATQSGDNPTWNQSLVNGIQYNNAHFIQSFAFVNGNHRAVIVFNLHRTSNLDVTFTGLYAPSGPVTMRRLSANAITDTNESAENVTIQTTNFTSFDPTQPLTLPPFSMTVLTAGDTAPPIPVAVQATAQSQTQVSVSWSLSSGAAQYEIARMSAGVPLQVVATAANPPYPDAVSASNAYLYRVRAVGGGARSTFSTPDIATTVPFSDDPIVAGVTMVSGSHLMEMRTAANAVNLLAGLSARSWTDPSIVPQVTLVQATHIVELRSSLTNAFGLLGLTVPTFANSIVAGSVIHGADIQELRDAVR
jgi:hypothetical protein